LSSRRSRSAQDSASSAARRFHAAVAPARRACARAIALLKEEVARNMALAGLRSIAEVTPDLVRRIGAGDV
jgi:isopentenyl diphosphate isomerase/L-lactate dehydrogenase-like FMN-dependent dehydrogenase